MGVYAVLTFLNGMTSSDFLLDSDLEHYVNVGDVGIKIIYPNIPDYVINTLTPDNINMKITETQLLELFAQGVITTGPMAAAMTQAANGTYTLQMFINDFLPQGQNAGSTSTLQGYQSTQEPYTLEVKKIAFSADGKSILADIVATPVGAYLPSGSTAIQINIQITDATTGKITNYDAYKKVIDGYQVEATFSENLPPNTNSVEVNFYAIEPYLSDQLANPIIGLKVSKPNSVTGILTSNTFVRDAVIGAALLVGVPTGIILAYKHHKKGKRSKEEKKDE